MVESGEVAIFFQSISPQESVGIRYLLAVALTWNETTGPSIFPESKLDKACFLIHGHIVQGTLYFCRIECIRLARNFFDSAVIHFFYHRGILGDDVHVLKGGLAVNREPGKSRGRKRDGRTHRKTHVKVALWRMRLILRDRKSLMPFVLLLRIRQLAIQIGSSSFASPDYSGFALRVNVRIYSLISSASCMRSINAGIIRTRRSQGRYITCLSCLMQICHAKTGNGVC